MDVARREHRGVAPGCQRTEPNAWRVCGSVLLRRMSPLMAPRVTSLRCQSSDAIGGEADMPRASRACRSDENDPLRSIGWIEILQRCNLLPCRAVLSFGAEAQDGLAAFLLDSEQLRSAQGPVGDSVAGW